MIAILDYEAGNQTSVRRALEGMGIPATITRNPEELGAAAGVIFPGVGAAGQAMGMLQRTGMDTVLRALIAEGKPLLGVCLGCQIMLERSEENDTPTLGIEKGICRRFDPALKDEEGQPIIIPHMGWNSLHAKQQSTLLEGIHPAAEFYFVHSYYTEPAPELVIATTTHGVEFCSIYGREGFWAVQFHPEKSGAAGLRLLRNFYTYTETR